MLAGRPVDDDDRDAARLDLARAMHHGQAYVAKALANFARDRLHLRHRHLVVRLVVQSGNLAAVGTCPAHRSKKRDDAAVARSANAVFYGARIDRAARDGCVHG